MVNNLPRMTTQGLKVYKDYCAIKTHYVDFKYDYFARNGKTRMGKLSYEKRHDKHFFEKLAKRKDYFNFIVANIAYDDAWIGDICLNAQAEECYKTFIRNRDSLSYVIRSDLKKLQPRFRDNFMVDGYNHPSILKQYVGGNITMETMTVLLDITSVGGLWDRKLGDDPLWKMTRVPVLKHKSFLKYRKGDIVEIVLDICDEW